MSLYEVKVQFKDGQDAKRLYKVGDIYPRVGYKPSDDRIEELTTDKNRRNVVAISSINLSKLKVDELKDIATKRDIDGVSSMKKAELIEALEGDA